MASTARRPRPPAAASADDETEGFTMKRGGMATKSVVDVRNYFPETWLFEMQMTEWVAFWDIFLWESLLS